MTENWWRKKRDAHFLAKHDMTHAEWKQLVRAGITGSYSQQKSNARERGIAWHLTLGEWWSIWQQSGHWNERGRGARGYVMCRVGDVGPYEVGNVFIGTGIQNTSEGRKTSNLPMGVSKHRNRFRAERIIDRVKHRLGSFATPEEAHAAYVRCGREHGIGI